MTNSDQEKVNPSDKTLFWAIGLMIGCPVLVCIGVLMIYAILTFAASSSGVAPYIYTLF